MEELSPFLRDLKNKKEGFKVPEGYFDGIEDAVFEKIKEQGVQKGTAMSAMSGGLMHRLLRAPMLYAAAAAVTLLITAWWFMRPIASNTLAAETDLTEAELKAYITENADEFEVDQLAILHSDDSATDAYDDLPETIPADSPKTRQMVPRKPFHSDDVKNLLDDMSEEELESLL